MMKMTKEKNMDKNQKECKHEWKDVGYGFGILKCKKCGERSH